MSKIIKPNCQKCYYTACFISKRGLASCECERITEPVIIELDKLMNKERRYVKRNKWDDECDCDCFIPDLSEAEQDFELEEVCTFALIVRSVVRKYMSMILALKKQN